MKLSIVLSTQPASFSAMVYKNEITENLSKIKSMGYDGVELAVRDPKVLDCEDIIAQLQIHNLRVPAIGTGQAFGEDGLSFTHPDLKIRERAIERIKSHISFALRLNAIVIIGLIRGQSTRKTERELAEDWLIESVRECAKTDKTINFAIEPINRYETDLLNTVPNSLSFLDKVKMDNVGLLLDTFHMNIEEPSIIGSIISSKDKLFHFHVADSNRWYPGAGHINFCEIIDTLNKIEYNQFISGEMLPLPDSDTSARKMVEFFRKLANDVKY